MGKIEPITFFWHRRDLRIEDNAGLYRALHERGNVVPVFIFDHTILSRLEDKNDARVSFIYQEIERLKQEYQSLGTSLWVFYGEPDKIWNTLHAEYSPVAVYTNHDYEPMAIERDKRVGEMLIEKGCEFKTFKDQVIFEKDEVLKDDGTPYTVFTPYSRKWKSRLNVFYLKSYPVLKYKNRFAKVKDLYSVTLSEMGFTQNQLPFPERVVKQDLVIKYKEQRDFPAINGTSRLSVHLRFGTISIRSLAREALKLNETFLNELIWREFYMMILFHFPNVVHQSFRPVYDGIKWRNNEEEFKRWCNGTTGYPIVDAGMRELNTTGHMHNRVRMIVASFLTKHLLIDWRWGEAYFAAKLLDFELASNNGGWQWAAGTGCDAAPYFRVFNPYEQTKKFDGSLGYIKKWVPEFQELNYPAPMVDHAFARQRALETYKVGLNRS